MAAFVPNVNYSYEITGLLRDCLIYCCSRLPSACRKENAMSTEEQTPTRFIALSLDTWAVLAALALALAVKFNLLSGVPW
jgi:hypothetical protein